MKLNQDKKLVLEFVDKRRALKDNVLDIEMKASSIGSKFSGGPEELVREAYRMVVKELPEFWKNYRMNMTCQFFAANEDGVEEKKGFTTGNFLKDQLDELNENFDIWRTPSMRSSWTTTRTTP